jgi:hypothetical protein
LHFAKAAQPPAIRPYTRHGKKTASGVPGSSGDSNVLRPCKLQDPKMGLPS